MYRQWYSSIEKQKNCLSPMTKAFKATKNSKKQSDNEKTRPKTSITQRSLTDLERSVGVTTVTWCGLNQFTGSRPSDKPQKLCYQNDTHLKIYKDPDRGPTTNQSGEAIKIITSPSGSYLRSEGWRTPDQKSERTIEDIGLFQVFHFMSFYWKA